MSTTSGTFSPPQVRRDPEPAHRIRVWVCAMFSTVLLLSLTIYGADYYLLPVGERPFSPKHALLRPSGAIGVNLGVLGTVLFLLIFLYAVRKRVPWLWQRGNTRHWMDFHIVAGISAPVVIALHASFKFRGIAGIAFWLMLAVAVSGVIGRYLYSQIPRSLNAAELSLQELHEAQESLVASLSGQTLFSADQLERVLHVPSPQEVQKMQPALALLLMIAIDISRPWRIAQLRRDAIDWRGRLRTFGGLLESGKYEVEQVIRAARLKSSLSKRIVFLGRTQQVFHLWHIIHRPFSYAFAVLAVLHIVVVMGLGFR